MPCFRGTPTCEGGPWDRRLRRRRHGRRDDRVLCRRSGIATRLLRYDHDIPGNLKSTFNSYSENPNRGRGAAGNPPNRFEPLHLETDPDSDHDLEDARQPVRTIFLKDTTQTILTTNESPDVGFTTSFNPYRGCEHGCIYCYARPTHEFLGFSAGLDFESRVLVKTAAPELLRRELENPDWRPQVIAASGVTDPYQPVERRLQLTRNCLQVLNEFRNPVCIVTKNHLVTRDLDLLASLNHYQAASVYVSITTLDPLLAARLEPRASQPQLRLEAVRELSEAGIPAGVMMAPVIPGVNDSEIPRILEASADAGARTAGYVLLRLPLTVKPLFEEWLAIHFPDRKNKVLHQLQRYREGKLNDASFGTRMSGTGKDAAQLQNWFDISRRHAGIPNDMPVLRTDAFRRRLRNQFELFDDAPGI